MFSRTTRVIYIICAEVVRTRLRETAPGERPLLRDVTIKLWRNGGVRSLYAGLGVHLLRQVPNAAIVLTTYELCVAALSSSSTSASSSSSSFASSESVSSYAPASASTSASESSPLGPVEPSTSSSSHDSHARKQHESDADAQVCAESGVQKTYNTTFSPLKMRDALQRDNNCH